MIAIIFWDSLMNIQYNQTKQMNKSDTKQKYNVIIFLKTVGHSFYISFQGSQRRGAVLHCNSGSSWIDGSRFLADDLGESKPSNHPDDGSLWKWSIPLCGILASFWSPRLPSLVRRLPGDFSLNESICSLSFEDLKKSLVFFWHGICREIPVKPHLKISKT